MQSDCPQQSLYEITYSLPSPGWRHVPIHVTGDISVPGVAQAPLDDAALAAVMNWMLARFDAAHLPAGFAPYTAAEVGRLRATPLTDVSGIRARLLAAAASDR